MSATVRQLDERNRCRSGDMNILYAWGDHTMFNLPLETFLWLVPWPFIWMAVAIVVFFKLKKEEEQEER